MLQELWANIRGRTVTPPSPHHLTVALPDVDADEVAADLGAIPDYAGQPISGFTCILAYCDGKKQVSERRVTCQSLLEAGAHRYLAAYCHERRARRQFRIDRIVQVIDLHSGEVCDDVPAFFDAFALDRIQRSGLSWGLSPVQRADLVAGLNAMVFVGRCDREWHPLERETLERFVTSFWLRHEIAADLPLAEISAHADRLSPDAETFFVALARCQTNKVLAAIIRRQLQAMIEADGVIRAEEMYWGSAVDRYLSS